jgi:hypothetical protein
MRNPAERALGEPCPWAKESFKPPFLVPEADASII